MSIYVEILVRAPMDALWAHTQTPSLHEQWDLRFSRIEQLPRTAAGERQRFKYTTRIGFGLEVSGEGESLARRSLPDGNASSALSFASDHAMSLISEGRGYWKYIPTQEGIRFLTWYDYRPRFGAAGELLDRLVFRPLFGWATAWSFDRLRLWLEQRIDPATALRQMLVHALARVALATVFAYQGLVPKLVARHADEVTLAVNSGIPLPLAGYVLSMLGVAEIVLAAALLVFWSRRWPAWVCLAAMPLALANVALFSPSFFAAAFNPFALNLGVAALAAIDLMVLDTVPSAARCLRHPRKEKQ